MDDLEIFESVAKQEAAMRHLSYVPMRLGGEFVILLSVDEMIFLQLYQGYADQIYRRLLKMLGNVEDAEDCSQQVWLRLWQYRPSGDHLDVWLRRVATNAAIDVLRRRYTQHRHLGSATLEEVAEQMEAPTPTPQESYAFSEQSQAAFSALGPTYQQAIYLHHILGISISEMSEMLGDTPFAIRTRLSRGRKTFRAAFTQKETG